VAAGHAGGGRPAQHHLLEVFVEIRGGNSPRPLAKARAAASAISVTARPVTAEVTSSGAQLMNSSVSRVASSLLSSSARLTRSPLFSTTTAARPDSSIRLASLASSAVAPGLGVDHQRGDVGSGQLVAGHLGRHGLGEGVDRPAARMPAVSTSTKSRPPSRKGVSMGSRVVPGWSWTRTRSSPSRRLTSDDLPTLGLPTKAMRMGASGASAASPSAGAGSAERTSGRTASRRSPMPLPWAADRGKTLGKPRP
jgi:hypothetical protein